MFPMPKQSESVDINRLRDRLINANVKLINHPATALYGGVILMGKSEIVDYVPTAATDGINKFYGAGFCSKQSDAQLRFIVMHEALHIGLRHLSRHKEFWEEDPMTANLAADYVDNALIMAMINEKLTDSANCTEMLFEKPTACVLYDPKYIGWSFGEVYRDLRQNRKQPPPPKPEKGEGQQGQQDQQGQTNDSEQTQSGGTGETQRPGEPGQDEVFGQPGTPFDHHDLSKIKGMSDEEVKDLSERIAKTIEQGALSIGKRGHGMPRVLADSITPKVDWVSQTREFVTSHTQGKDDDLSLRRFDRRWLEQDLIVPGSIAETVGEVLFACDTSGSIDDEQVAEATSELASLATSIQPERVRTLWWDHMVHGEQVFTSEHYDQISKLVKPQGGGGTRVSSVAQHVRDNNTKVDCLIVMTDGYVESDIDWDSMPPTLWIVTRNKEFNPPTGRVVFYHNN